MLMLSARRLLDTSIVRFVEPQSGQSRVTNSLDFMTGFWLME